MWMVGQPVTNEFSQHVPAELVFRAMQSVHCMFNGDFTSEWAVDEDRSSKVVFIGQGLDRDALQSGFEACRSEAL